MIDQIGNLLLRPGDFPRLAPAEHVQQRKESVKRRIRFHDFDDGRIERLDPKPLSIARWRWPYRDEFVVLAERTGGDGGGVRRGDSARQPRTKLSREDIFEAMKQKLKRRRTDGTPIGR